MPTAALRFCAKPGCANRVPSGYCDECRRSSEKARGTKQERGYGDAWPKLRSTKLASDPLCEDCKDVGRVKLASQVHHIRKIADAPALRLALENLRSLCVPCHNARTARGE